MLPKTHTIKVDRDSTGRMAGVVTPIYIPLPINYPRLLLALLKDEQRRRQSNPNCPTILKTMYDTEILFLKSKLDPYEKD